jgi:hypothetical protein
VQPLYQCLGRFAIGPIWFVMALTTVLYVGIRELERSFKYCDHRSMIVGLAGWALKY